MTNDIVVWDLDSTLADTSPRHHLSPFVNPDQTWHSYSKACTADKPMLGCIFLINALYDRYETHIVTGRRSSARIETVDWLRFHKVSFDVLRMRQDDDLESNIDYKIHYMRNLPRLPRLFVSDWSPECQAVRKKLGIPVVCINPEYDSVYDPTMVQWAATTPSLLDNE